MKSLVFIDKTNWAQGEWTCEADKIQYKCNETGYDCLIRRNASGALCGYVGVTKSHVAYGRSYYVYNAEDPIDKKICDIEVHGGLTFSDLCQEDDKETGICHVTEGDEDNVWWFGFDCAHYGDLIPKYVLLGITNKDDRYKNINYVKSEIKLLAKQLFNLAEKGNQ